MAEATKHGVSGIARTRIPIAAPMENYYLEKSWTATQPQQLVCSVNLLPLVVRALVIKGMGNPYGTGSLES